jgi:hypothetical protein
MSSRQRSQPSSLSPEQSPDRPSPRTLPPPRQIVRVRTLRTLNRPEVSALVLRAAESIGYDRPALILREISGRIADEHLGCFVGFVEERPRVLVIAELPISALSLAPWVVVAYGEKAPRQLAADMGLKVRGWLEKHGFSQALALNLQHTDRSFAVYFGRFATPEVIGSLVRFRWEARSAAAVGAG